MKDPDNLASANVRHSAANVIKHFHMRNEPIVMGTENEDGYSSSRKILLCFDV